MHIRRAVVADAKLISGLSEVTFFDTFQGTCTAKDMEGFIKQCFNESQVTEELENISDFYFISFVDNVATGYIRMKEDESEVGEIKNHKSIELKRIYVLKEHHSKKIGASLMQFALNFAAENEYEILWLGVWEQNEKAITFYKKFGFEDTGFRHPFPIGNTPQTDNWMIRYINKEREV